MLRDNLSREDAKRIGVTSLVLLGFWCLFIAGESLLTGHDFHKALKMLPAIAVVGIPGALLGGTLHVVMKKRGTEV